MALNTRIYPRHRIRVEIRYKSAASFREAWVSDISHGGVFLETQEKLAPGQAVTVELILPGKAGTIEIPSRVVHSLQKSALGAGLEFGPIPAKSKKILEAYVDKLGLDLSSRK